MANAVASIDGIAIANIAGVNGITDANLQALNGLEFTAAATDSHILISSTTLSNTASLTISSGIDSTYDIYEFHFISIHSENDNGMFSFQVNNATDGADYNDSQIMSSYFTSIRQESSVTAEMVWKSAGTFDNATSYIAINLAYTGSTTNQNFSGIMRLYAPSSTTFVKQFEVETASDHTSGYALNTRSSGYINDTKAIDDISFKFDNGQMTNGYIKMYGIAKS
jgi:hypothetical protein